METRYYKISGMGCKHCARRVQQAIEPVAGVSGVEVDLNTATARVTGDADPIAVVNAVVAAGYQAVPM